MSISHFKFPNVFANLLMPLKLAHQFILTIGKLIGIWSALKILNTLSDHMRSDPPSSQHFNATLGSMRTKHHNLH